MRRHGNSIGAGQHTNIPGFHDAADPADVGRAVADTSSWRRWWPDLRLTVVEDRGPAGQRWTVAGALTGTMEVWLQPMMDGVIQPVSTLRPAVLALSLMGRATSTQAHA